jgi:hypothetical protein
LKDDGAMVFTTLVRSKRIADRYLSLCEKSGELVSRDVTDIRAAFAESSMLAEHDIVGNMAFIRYNMPQE